MYWTSETRGFLVWRIVILFREEKSQREWREGGERAHLNDMRGRKGKALKEADKILARNRQHSHSDSDSQLLTALIGLEPSIHIWFTSFAGAWRSLLPWCVILLIFLFLQMGAYGCAVRVCDATWH